MRTQRLSLAHLGIVLGLLASGVIVWQASRAAFSAQTSVTTNTFDTGSVTIGSDRAGQLVFSTGTSNMAPGATATKCVKVTYSGTLSARVKVYAPTYVDSGLGPYLVLTLEEGSGGDYSSCTGFSPAHALIDAATADSVFGGNAHSTYSTGLGGAWTPSGTESTTYRLTYSLPSETTQGAGTGIAIAFTWEAQSV